MANKIIWLPEAYDDLQKIWNYIAHQSPMYAGRFTSRILATVQRLTRFPRQGRMIPEWNDVDNRELIEGNYRILYRVDHHRIIIFAIIHGARILPDELRDRR